MRTIFAYLTLILVAAGSAEATSILVPTGGQGTTTLSLSHSSSELNGTPFDASPLIVDFLLSNPLVPTSVPGQANLQAQVLFLTTSTVDIGEPPVPTGMIFDPLGSTIATPVLANSFEGRNAAGVRFAVYNLFFDHNVVSGVPIARIRFELETVAAPGVGVAETTLSLSFPPGTFLVVPEPGSFSLVVLGVALIGLESRRRLHLQRRQSR